jgi:hypothetical protein
LHTRLPSNLDLKSHQNSRFLTRHSPVPAGLSSTDSPHSHPKFFQTSTQNSRTGSLPISPGVNFKLEIYFRIRTCSLSGPEQEVGKVREMGFSFGFRGDDIDEDENENLTKAADLQHEKTAAETGTLGRRESTAFPVQGQAQLEAKRHELETLLRGLPEVVSWSLLGLKLDADEGEEGEEVSVPRRELWDVRAQAMGEDEMADAGEAEGMSGIEGLGKDDVKTGIYEGGFKSWESSVDLVRVLGGTRGEVPGVVVEVSLSGLIIVRSHMRSKERN